MLNNKTILITGGTGSFGKYAVDHILNNYTPKKLIIFSRDEFKQFDMSNNFKNKDKNEVLRFFLGDIRDKDRLSIALKNVDIVIHAAALKQVPALEYNPFEAVKTNIIGAQNVITASIENGVQQVIALSTDKAANPINLYGATKLVSDKIFVNGNKISAQQAGTKFSVVRYGNVLGSRGSVIPFFLEQRKSKVIHITDKNMTRFWITLEQATNFVLNSLKIMKGGEIFIPKIPSMKIIDLAEVIASKCDFKFIGIRPGEKLHEIMIPKELGRNTVDLDSCYCILNPDDEIYSNYKKLDGFEYSSENNTQWLSKEEMYNICVEKLKIRL